jgi:predicted kinase
MKLIFINGPCGVGKSTLAHNIHNQLSMSVRIDIDEIRRLIADYREHRQASGLLAFELAFGMIESALKNGCDVIIDKIMFNYSKSPKNYLQEFQELAKKYQAEFLEFILKADKKVIVDRVIKRGLDKKSLLTMDRVEEFCDEIDNFIPQRKKAKLIETTNLTEIEVFEKVWKIINK